MRQRGVDVDVDVVQVRTRPIWDGLDAALRGPLTRHFEHLKYRIDQTVLTGNFQMIRDDYQ